MIQLHGGVMKAVAYFRDVLRFRTEFLYGEPTAAARGS
jgi:hypothetical protein